MKLTNILMAGLLLALSIPGYALNATFSDNDTIGKCRIFLSIGEGRLLLDASSGNGFGGGTVTAQVLKEAPDSSALDMDDQANWITSKTYTTVPSPNPETMNFRAPTWFQLILSGATAPTLYCEVVAGVKD